MRLASHGKTHVFGGVLATQEAALGRCGDGKERGRSLNGLEKAWGIGC